MRIFLFLTILSLTSSCGSGNLTKPQNFKALISDTLNFRHQQNLTNALNLQNISRGVDSFELRLWSSLGGTDLEFVTILKFTDSTWHLNETRYWTSHVSNYPKRDIIILDSSVTTKVTPKFGIHNLIDSLDFFNLENIPNQHTIPGFRDRTADGMYYTIECATKSNYKILSYHNPNRYQDSNHRRVTQMVNFFRRNLNVFAMD